jgi:kinesin family protein C2/C3
MQVDSGKAEDIVKAEMALLRGAVDGSPVSVSSAGGSSAADAAKISALEAENTKLRDLLAEAQRELLSAAKSKTAADSSKEEWAAELAALNGLVQKHEASLRSQAAAIDAKSKQLDAAEAEVASLKSASSNSSSKSQEEVAVLVAALAKSRRELEEARAQQTAESAAAAAQLKALEERMSAEKEELMEAVAQEVELVERTKAEEAAALQLSVAALEAQVTASRKESGDLASGLQKLHKAAHDMSSANAHVSAVTRKELGEMRVALLNNFKGEFVKKLRHANKEYLELKDKYLKEMGERRRLHNIVAELKGNIRVFMRCRPPTKKELDQFGNDALCVSFSDLVAGEVRVFNADKGRDKSWEFDEVFDLAATQEKVYREVSPLVISVLDGYNGACVRHNTNHMYLCADD